ncbi:unnamed protein product [Chilo suppressalis]|uniref:Uncharacterized protein n=1 Tax=Chilo suppressalis TaxID=168631 RepID=A0ABN8B639_CHISP|nr:unnamed protein product [Chilo suppressalis]
MYDIKVDDSFFNDNQIHDEIQQDDFSEHIPIEESFTAQQQTLLWNEEQYLRIAPGEENVPESLLFDEHAEELSFPAIYLGQFRNFRDGVKVTPFMMASTGGVAIYQNMHDTTNVITLNIDMTVRQAELTTSTVTSVGEFCAAECKMENGNKIVLMDRVGITKMRNFDTKYSARTVADMSQDVCHRPRRSLNEFRSRRAKNTRTEHARVKSCASGATPREAVPAPAPPPPSPPLLLDAGTAPANESQH